MPKSLTLGNGNIMACLDKNAEVRDFYYPYIGLENHIGGHNTHRVGLWTEGKLAWLHDPTWNVTVNCENGALMGNTQCENKTLGLDLALYDVVYNEKNVLLRHAVIYNKSPNRRTVKMFFGHEFEIYESHSGDTAYYDPRNKTVIHYNGRRVFLANGVTSAGSSFSEYTTGIFHIEGKEGSYKDAEDGQLSKNPIEHGPTDSVLGFSFELEPEGQADVYYWLAAGKSIEEVHELNTYVLGKSPEHLMRTTRDFWRAWSTKQNFNFYGLDDNIVSLFKKSLFTVRVHADNHGSIIASGDSDVLNGRDTYAYMWPRDASYAALAMDLVGDSNVALRFFQFCNTAITSDGYFMHKYRPDGSLGSSWHPWVARDGVTEHFPIQEDEAALPLIALARYYDTTKDLEFIESVYNSLIKKAADFMVVYRDEATGLPKPTYDLWEEKYGVTTFTACTVYGALIAAARFAEILGKTKSQKLYTDTAHQVREGILKYLYDAESGLFLKMINFEHDAIVADKTIDMSSVYGVYAFGVLPHADPRVARAVKLTEERLSAHTFVGGIARYEGDRYYRKNEEGPGNPWFITTLWLAQYHIAIAEQEKDFEVVKKWLNWVVDYAAASGVLSEQLDPKTGEQLSAAPLVWSHAEYVITIISYLDKLEELGICQKCNPVY
ncbi:MAG: hypothetical protein A2675_03420 [Candidatus Yonathbacteria bacterium RIFCSPHIGHO2_01_FULL_51_10]|uniref:GH15-like domain-containing protein n=1 Tax=Candidatus Yonathbacteria bacterium RIFCSPHIGHO2_01_FULL_51_10 TaxID=1802723 RepID=A0A1G2S8P5_9BACT|nr:MAG: hypothetical protein A2675_03420 [Candidatus Yonathbacteria bacterium RIFCSPHIGHO2_01_FULL_51_10]